MDVKITKEVEGCAVYCQELGLRVRVRLVKVSTRAWRLIPQRWENAAWTPSAAIGTQTSQAQAFVHAGAWLQSVREMAGNTQEDDERSTAL